VATQRHERNPDELAVALTVGRKADAEPSPSTWTVAAVILLGLLGALVTYKASGSLATIAKVQASDTLTLRSEWITTAGHSGLTRPLLRTVNYLAVVWPALVFGVLIGGAVRATVPSRWIREALGDSPVRAQLLGGLAGAPLMLCSCCIAPVFVAVSSGTKRAGPASALLLASPSLNPAALALTFMLFTTDIAVARLVTAALLVFVVSAMTARYLPPGEHAAEPCALEVVQRRRPLDALAFLGREVARTARTTLPVLVLGIVLSSAAFELVPLDRLREAPVRAAAIVLVALVSVPLALPTFAEIPLALGLLATGAPAGAAVALMIAGPAINLPSLLTVARTTTRRHAIALAAGTFVSAAAGGLLV
jgi:uncharacterized membrane protein YraQ (UPF0718 family)